MKQKKHKPKKHYEDMELPKNTGMGIYISAFGFVCGFALVWQIVWLAILSAIGVIACIIIRSFDDHTEYKLAAAEVEKIEKRTKPRET